MRNGVRTTAIAATLGCVLFCAGPATAAVTLGQLQSSAADYMCQDQAMVQTAVSAGTTFRVPPEGGVITAWRTRTLGFANQSMQLVVFDGDVGSNIAKPLYASELEPLVSNQLNEFDTAIPVSGGERLGLYSGPNGPAGCGYIFGMTPDADRALTHGGAPALGSAVGFGESISPMRIPIEVDLEADNDRDAFGDESQDSCPSDPSIQVPCTPEINKRPKKKLRARKATFEFSVPAGGGVTFECQIDKKEFVPCESPFTVKKLKPRKHTFRVRAKDSAGQVGGTIPVKFRTIQSGPVQGS